MTSMSPVRMPLANASTSACFHQPERTEPMRLKQHKKPPRMIVRGGERCCDLIGVVGEIVDHADAARRAHRFIASSQARETRKRIGCGLERHAAGARGG